MIDRVAHVTWRGRHWTEWSILIYYAGWVLLAASTPLLSPSHWVYAAMAALVGAWGIGAWAARWERTEATAIVTLAAATVVQAVPLLASGVPESVMAGCRLLLAPGTLIPVAVLRRTDVLLAVVRARRDAA